MRKCDITRELLPLYIEDCCSAGSREFVEEHLKECEKCRKIYQEMTAELSVEEPVEVPEQSEEFYFKKGKEVIEYEVKNSFVRKLAILDIVIWLVVLIFMKDILILGDMYESYAMFFAGGICVFGIVWQLVYLIRNKMGKAGNISRNASLGLFLIKIPPFIIVVITLLAMKMAGI